MNKTVSICCLISLAKIVAVLAICRPNLISDDGNSFLAGFIPHEFLAIIGVMLTKTLASAGQIHLTLNSIEEKKNRVIFRKTRSNVKAASYGLIALFLALIVLVTIKPYILKIAWAETIINGFAIFFLVWTSYIMISLTQLIFTIQPEVD